MKNINLKSLVGKFKNNAAAGFYLILAVAIILEMFLLYTAVKQAILARQAPVDSLPSKGVRLNFAEYEEAAKRVEAGKKFLPNPPIYENPFSSR